MPNHKALGNGGRKSRRRVVPPASGGALTGGSAGLGVRVGLAVAAVAAMVGLLTYNALVRNVEALTVEQALRYWIHARVVRDIIVVEPGQQHTIALRITPECTASLLVLPAVAMFCLFVIFRGVRIGRAVGGIVAACGFAYLANQIRILFIAVSWMYWGNDGVWVAHILVGTAISLVTIFAILVVQVWVTAIKGRVSTREY